MEVERATVKEESANPPQRTLKQQLEDRRIANALKAIMAMEKRKAPQKIKSKKKRRALARKAHKSRVRNG